MRWTFVLRTLVVHNVDTALDRTLSHARLSDGLCFEASTVGLVRHSGCHRGHAREHHNVCCMVYNCYHVARCHIALRSSFDWQMRSPIARRGARHPLMPGHCASFRTRQRCGDPQSVCCLTCRYSSWWQQFLSLCQRSIETSLGCFQHGSTMFPPGCC